MVQAEPGAVRPGATLPGPGPGPGRAPGPAAPGLAAPAGAERSEAAPQRRSSGTDAWLTTVNLLIGLWTGLFSFVFLGWMIPLALVLTPLFMIGLPILAIALVLCRRFGRLERSRYQLVLGTEISDPHPTRPGGNLIERFRFRVREAAS